MFNFNLGGTVQNRKVSASSEPPTGRNAEPETPARTADVSPPPSPHLQDLDDPAAELFDARDGLGAGAPAKAPPEGPPQRSLDDPAAVAFKRNMLTWDRARKITLSACRGDQEARQLANQILTFLWANGFDVSGVGDSLKPVVGFARDDSGPEMKLIVGRRP